jgi:hypothetical protein
MGRTLRRVIAVCAAAAVTLGAPVASHAAPTDRHRAVIGAAFLAEEQRPNGSLPAFSPIGSTADAVLAFVAAGAQPRARASAIGYLSRQVRAGHVTGVGLTAKVALAVAAVGRDPRAFAGHNLIFEIRSTEGTDGRFGGGTAAVFDEALAILAFRGADTRASRDALAWLRAAQCPDGGWAYDDPYDPADDTVHCRSRSAPSSDFFRSDTNTTAYAVQALEASGNRPYSVDPFLFFATIRDPHRGGWGYTWGLRGTDANSTALVLQAYAAAGRTIPKGARPALRRLQWLTSGGWGFTWTGTRRGPADVGATIGAIPGLLGDPFPLGPETLRVRSSRAQSGT